VLVKVADSVVVAGTGEVLIEGEFETALSPVLAGFTTCDAALEVLVL
jgi:hypothetical protein